MCQPGRAHGAPGTCFIGRGTRGRSPAVPICAVHARRSRPRRRARGPGGCAGHPREHRQPAEPVLAEQAERARGRHRPQRPRTSSSRAPTTTSTWRPATPGPTTPARSPRASASPASTSPRTPAASWTQPTYTGLSARGCLGVVGPDPGCTPTTGPIGTLPNYAENDLVSDGDPAVAFGPQPTSGGGFSYADGSRLYYANLTSALPGTAPFKGAEAIAVSHTDDVAARGDGSNAAWSDPVIASRQTSAPVLRQGAGVGRQRRVEPVLRQRLRLLRRLPRQRQRLHQPAARRPDLPRRRRHWTQHQVTPATNNTHSRNGFGRSGCTVRTDSHGVVYVFDFQFGFSPTTAAAGQIQMIRSFDGGAHWAAPGEHLHRLRHVQRVRAVDRPLRRGRRRRRAQRPLARAVGRHRQRRAERRRRHRTGSCSAGSTVATGSTTSTSCSARSTSGGARWTHAAPGRARRRPRLLLGAGDLAQRHRRLARLQRVHGAVQGQRGRGGQRPAAVGPGPARDGRRRRRRRVRAASHRGADRRRARLVAERPRRGVPRRLRLRGGDERTTA